MCLPVQETQRDVGSIPGSGRSPEGENSNPLQYSCLENSMHRGAWWDAVHGVAKSQTLIEHTPLPLCTFILEKDFVSLFLNVNVQSVQWLSRVRLFATPWTAACQASLSITNSQSQFKLLCITLVMVSTHSILCYPILLWYSVFPSIRVFSNESVLHITWPKYLSFSFINRSD